MLLPPDPRFTTKRNIAGEFFQVLAQLDSNPRHVYLAKSRKMTSKLKTVSESSDVTSNSTELGFYSNIFSDNSLNSTNSAMKVPRIFLDFLEKFGHFCRIFLQFHEE